MFAVEYVWPIIVANVQQKFAFFPLSDGLFLCSAPLYQHVDFPHRMDATLQ